MSLKAFHIFFISLSALMCLGIGGFRAHAYSQSGQMAVLAQAVGSLIVGGALIVYGRQFLKKTRDLSYL